MSSWDCSAYCLRSLVTVMDTPAGSEMMLSERFNCAMLVFPAPLLALPAHMDGNRAELLWQTS